jgi:iron complex outermembrane receptor protein
MTGRPHDMPDYLRMDAGIHWQKEHIRLSLLANNILDKYLYMGAPYEFNNDFSSSEYYFMVEPKLNFRINAAYRW